MFWSRSRGLLSRNMHFSSCSADLAEFYAVRLAERRLRQFGLQECRESGSRKSIDESVAGRRRISAKHIELAQRLTKKPRRCKRLVHPQPEIGIGDLDTGPQQDPPASALRRPRPHCLQDFLRFQKISSLVRSNA